MEEKYTKIDELKAFSNFDKAQEKAEDYLGAETMLFTSPRKDKKYRIYDPVLNKWVDFGQMGYEDFTKHQDPIRRQRYLDRSTNIKGKWKDDKFDYFVMKNSRKD